ncbi:MBL fold metallo-hydrolase [Patescibacteria group bacterium]|nr:MBL fold metallo-hydrolase [Patescibacteria group bacterium]
MELKYLGQSSFRMRFKSGMILVINPLDKQKCDIVALSRAQKDGGFVEETFVISEEGEYEIGGVGVVVIKEGEKNLIMVIRQNGITTCHLGNLSHDLSEKQIEEIGPVDVLLLPVGGKLGELISNISPSIVVPMWHKEKELAEFLDSSSLEIMLEGVDKVKIDANTLPENTKCLVLKSHHTQ